MIPRSIVVDLGLRGRYRTREPHVHTSSRPGSLENRDARHVREEIDLMATQDVSHNPPEARWIEHQAVETSREIEKALR